MTKGVYAFGGGNAEGSGSQRDLLGGKGANLAEMAHLGLPVPPGFTVTTAVCTHFYGHDRHYPDSLRGTQPSGAMIGNRITLEELEREHILRIIEVAGSMEEAAQILGIDPATLYRKRKRYAELAEVASMAETTS